MSASKTDTGDQPVLQHIEKLVAEEHTLYNRGTLDDAGRSRLEHIQVELDQCWDLLRQRRARREFGGNPDGAAVRSPNVVEHYQG